MGKLEKKISVYFGRKYCLLTGNGTTAMYLFFKASNFNQNVLYPSITCRHAVNAATNAKQKVLFCDVNKSDFTIDTRHLEKLTKKKKISCLVLTHLYGHVCNIDSIINICSKNNIEILEDAAQSIGAFYKGILVGSFGRASVLSFGYSKILDCGGGGAILTDDKKLYSKMKNLNKSLPRRNKNYYKNLELYKKTYYDIEGIKNKNNYYKLSGYFEKRMSKNFIVSINRRIKENINSQFGYLKKTIEDRMNKAKLYSRYLNRKYFLHPKPNSGSVYWRYTLLAKKRRDELVKFLRENKIDASTWYSGVNKIYNKKTAKLPNTKFVQEKVLNLWLDKKTSKRKIRKTIRLANSFFKK